MTIDATSAPNDWRQHFLALEPVICDLKSMASVLSMLADSELMTGDAAEIELPKKSRGKPLFHD